jgi:hypothetical protein
MGGIKKQIFVQVFSYIVQRVTLLTIKGMERLARFFRINRKIWEDLTMEKNKGC